MTNLTNEEMLAKALADELRPWLARIKALETETAVQQRRIELHWLAVAAAAQNCGPIAVDQIRTLNAHARSRRHDHGTGLARGAAQARLLVCDRAGSAKARD